jgi:hypothetical protein
LRKSGLALACPLMHFKVLQQEITTKAKQRVNSERKLQMPKI